MQVTNVRVSFLREKQPAQFEKARPEVEFAAVIETDEDHLAVARKLMIDATSIVYAGIGYAVPDRVAEALAGGDVPSAVVVDTVIKEVAPAASTVEETPTEAIPEAKKPAAKKRGRPKGSRNTRPKAGTAAAEDAKGGLVKAVTASDIPGNNDIPGDPPRVGPEDDPKDHGAEPEKKLESKEEGPRREFTARDLHTMIMDLINAKPPKLSVASAKQILAHFQVARAQDLTDEQVIEGKAMIEKMVTASEK